MIEYAKAYEMSSTQYQRIVTLEQLRVSFDTNPTDLEARSNGLRYFFKATKSLEYDLEPMAIQLISNGDATIVHYKLRNVIMIKETGEKEPGTSYWTDYLVRENDGWLLISDHGGSVPEEDPM